MLSDKFVKSYIIQKRPPQKIPKIKRLSKKDTRNKLKEKLMIQLQTGLGLEQSVIVKLLD